jgi:small-conductance mechanosensitive channel
VIIGVIVGLSALEVNIGPELAVVGAASFAIAITQQDRLSNFAGGLMIMWISFAICGLLFYFSDLSGLGKKI